MKDEAVVQIWQAIVMGITWCVTIVTYTIYKWAKRGQDLEREQLRMKETRDALREYR